MAKKFNSGNVGRGALVAVGGTALGAAIGAATSTPCDSNNWFLCGPKVGAEFGALYGAAITGVAALAVAAMSPKNRNLALGTAGATFGVFAAAAIVRTVTKTPQQPAATPVTAAPPVTALPPAPATPTPTAAQLQAQLNSLQG